MNKTRLLIDNAMSNTTIIKDDLKKIKLLHMNLCQDMFDEYKDTNVHSLNDVVLAFSAMKEYAIYADVVLDYIIKISKLMDDTDTLLDKAYEQLVSKSKSETTLDLQSQSETHIFDFIKALQGKKVYDWLNENGEKLSKSELIQIIKEYEYYCKHHEEISQTLFECFLECYKNSSKTA